MIEQEAQVRHPEENFELTRTTDGKLSLVHRCEFLQADIRIAHLSGEPWGIDRYGKGIEGPNKYLRIMNDVNYCPYCGVLLF